MPVAGVGDGESSDGLDHGGNEHGFVSRKDSLAPRHFTVALVDGLDSTGTLNAVRLVGERLVNVAVVVAVQATVHGQGIGILGLGIPLSHHHAWLASDGAVASWLTLLIRAHSPASVHVAWRDGDQVGVVGRELAVASTLGDGA